MADDRITPQQFDLAVIGGGASGLTAALTAALGGARVVLLEKLRHLGGSSSFAEGMFAVESEMQRPVHMTYTRDQAFRSIMDYSHWRANPRLVRAFVDESASTIQWLQDIGVEFREVTTNFPDGLRTLHVLKGPPAAVGAPMIRRLTALAKQNGVDIRPGNAARQILIQGGKVAGVICEKAGKAYRLDVRAVVVASGGYANNADWIKRYAGLNLGVNIIPIRNTEKVGDGIRLAWEAGAAEEGMGVLHLYRIGPMGPGVPMKGHLECAAAQPGLWVDQAGTRFCNEAITFNDTYMGNAIARLKEGHNFSIFDEVARREMVEEGIERSAALVNPPGTRLVNFEKELRSALEQHNTDIAVANSIKDLAYKIGCRPSVLAATVDEYNRYCDTGRDRLFAKDIRYLRPIKQPPFYAMKAHTVFLGTLGGIKVNERLQAVDGEDRIIPGLYAVGTDAGGLYGDSYCYEQASGATLGFAVNSGRIAARDVLRYIGL